MICTDNVHFSNITPQICESAQENVQNMQFLEELPDTEVTPSEVRVYPALLQCFVGGAVEKARIEAGWTVADMLRRRCVSSKIPA